MRRNTWILQQTNPINLQSDTVPQQSAQPIKSLETMHIRRNIDLLPILLVVFVTSSAAVELAKLRLTGTGLNMLTDQAGDAYLWAEAQQ